MAQLDKDEKKKEQEKRRISLADSLYISALFLLIDALIDMIEALPFKLPPGTTKMIISIIFVFFAVYIWENTDEGFLKFLKRNFLPFSDVSYRPIWIILMFYLFFALVFPNLLT